MADIKYLDKTGLGKIKSILDGLYSATSHNHNTLYYTKTETDNKLSGKSNTSHTHSYLPLSGGTMSGPITFNDTATAMIKYGAWTSTGLGSYPLPSLGSSGIGIFVRPSKSTDEGGLIITEDTCMIFNSADNSWSFQVHNTDLSQKNFSGTDGQGEVSRVFGIQDNGSYVWSRGGYKKNGSSDSYALLGGGGHIALSSFAEASHTHGYWTWNENTIKGVKVNNAGNATTTGDGTITIIPQYNNEINFGGTNTSSAVYFGYRAAGSKPIPTAFVFGGSTGSATITASGFIKNGSNDNYALLGGGGHIALSSFAEAGHNHDSRYYTESEIDTKLAGKAASSHSHLFWNLGDASLKMYQAANTHDCGSETFCLQTCFDAKDGETHDYVTNYSNRCILNLQPRGGYVGIGKMTPLYTLDVNGSANAITLYENGIRVSVSGHTHDSRYYTESEIDTKLSGKANSSHSHNYLPLTGGELTGALTINAGANVGLNIKRTTTFPCIGIYGGSTPTIYGYYGFNGADTPAFCKSDGTSVCSILHSGNSSVSKSGETLTVKINGTTCSLTNTNTWPSNYVTTDTAQTITGEKTFAANILTISNPNNGDATLKFYRGGNTPWTIVDTGGNLKFNELTSNTTRLVLYENSQGGSASFTGTVSSTGFIKSGSSSSYVLLGDGGHKAISDFATSGHTHSYLPLTGGSLTDTLVISKSASSASTITPDTCILKLGTRTSGHSGYNTGLGFNALRYGTYIEHLHAWIGLGKYTTTATAECYPLIFATNESTTTNTAPLERMSIAPNGNVNIKKNLTVDGSITSNGSTVLTGINSQMVINALGYTPYNSTNPNGYITSSGSITGSSGSCTGNAATASKLTNLNTADAASSTATKRKVWFSYDDGVTGRPALSDNLTFQSSTNTLFSTNFNGSLTGNATTATILKPNSGITTDVASWNPLTSYTKCWGQKFISSSLSSDTGDILYYLRRGDSGYGSTSTTELCVCIDGDYYGKGGGGTPKKVSYEDHTHDYASSSHNHDSTYLKLSGGTMTGSIIHSGLENNGTRIIYGATRNSGLKYDYQGNECLMISAGTYTQASMAFYTCNRVSLTDGNNQWPSSNPDMHIKNGCVHINKIIANGANASYNLDVNGSANATTLYENGTRVSVSGHNHDDRYYTESEVDTKLAGKSNTDHTHSYLPFEQSVTGKNMDTIKTTGFYYGYNMTNSASTNISSFIVAKYSPDWGSQIQLCSSNKRAYIRYWQNSGGIMSSWNTLAYTSDIPTSLPASDVYAWAKAASKPSYNFGEIGAGVATIGDGANRLMFRTNASYRNGIYYSTPGNEALVFGTVNPVTSWIFATTDPTSQTDWRNLTPSMQIKNGKVIINKLIASGSEATYNLEVNGNINASSGFFDTSDERLKDFYDDIEIDFEKLKSIPKKYFSWKDDERKELQLGTSAQKVQELYPEIVNSDNEGNLSVSYNKLAIVSLAAVDKLYDENQELKSKIIEMEESMKLLNERLSKIESFIENLNI